MLVTSRHIDIIAVKFKLQGLLVGFLCRVYT